MSIQESEHFIKYFTDTEQIEGYDEEVLMTQIRVWAHWLDKDLQFSRRIEFTEKRLENLSQRIQIYRRKFDTGKPDFKWAEKIENLYKKAIKEKDQFQYEWQERQKIDIPESEFEKLLTSRRSIRRFTMQDIPDEMIRKLLVYGSWAPTNCDQQSLRYIVIKDPEIREKLTHGGMDGEMSPCVIVVVADMRFYSDIDIESPAHDSGAAIQNILLGAHYFGLGACYTSSQVANSIKNRRLFNLKNYEKITAMIWLGFYLQAPITPARRNSDEIIEYR